MRKIKICIFGRNPKAAYFMTETLIVQKVAYILASLCEGERFSYLFPVRRKISYKLEKKWKKQKKCFITLFAKKIQSEKNFDITFSLKRSLHKPRKINETMNPIFGLGHDIYEFKLKRTKKFFWKKSKLFWLKNEGVIHDDGNFVSPKSSLYQCCSSRKRTVSVSFISFEKYELRMRKKISKKFCLLFCPKTPSMKKNFDVIFRPKCSL